MAIDLERIVKALESNSADSKQKPPVDQWQPERVGEIDIVIDKNNDWYHEGTLFKRDALVRLFASILRKDEDGYYLVTPVEKLKITVEDVPFKITSLLERPGEPLRLISNVEDIITLDRGCDWQLRNYDNVSVPYIRVRSKLYARVDRPVYYQMMEMAESRHAGDTTTFYLQSAGQSFTLGEVADDDFSA